MKKPFLFIFILAMLWFPSTVLGKVKVPILVYHSIDEFKGHGQKELYVTPENFEKQMNYLKNNGFTLLTFERWQDINKVKKPIFITIDDGYQNNLNAFSIFQKLADRDFHPVATLFVISDYIGAQSRLTHAELKKLADSSFFSIQSHTASHPDLAKVSNYEYELNTSKKRIEKITGKPVIAIAYPYGIFNNKIVNEAKRYYQFGLTTTPGPFIESGIKDELYVLPRTYVKYSTTMDDFAKMVKGNE